MAISSCPSPTRRRSRPLGPGTTPRRFRCGSPRPPGGPPPRGRGLFPTGSPARPAPEVAALLAKRLAARPGVRDARATGPGFLTITMDTPLTARIDETYGLATVPTART